MREYYSNKNVLTGIVATLISLSITTIVMRFLILKEDALNAIDYGEPFVTLIISFLLLLLVSKGKDRLFYIVCGGWLAYFVLNIIFSMPFMIMNVIDSFTAGLGVTYTVAVVFRLISMICIIVIGALMVEYLNDGTIHNKAFMVSCAVAMSLLLIYVILSIIDLIRSGSPEYVFATLFGTSWMTSVLLFVYFAYDTAKTQLSKTQL